MRNIQVQLGVTILGIVCVGACSSSGGATGGRSGSGGAVTSGGTIVLGGATSLGGGTGGSTVGSGGNTSAGGLVSAGGVIGAGGATGGTTRAGGTGGGIFAVGGATGGTAGMAERQEARPVAQAERQGVGVEPSARAASRALEAQRDGAGLRVPVALQANPAPAGRSRPARRLRFPARSALARKRPAGAAMPCTTSPI
jgi:hypothetical protein